MITTQTHASALPAQRIVIRDDRRNAANQYGDRAAGRYGTISTPCIPACRVVWTGRSRWHIGKQGGQKGGTAISIDLR